jgi:hypothetical protein
MDQARQAVSSISDTLSPDNIVEQVRSPSGAVIIAAVVGVVILIFTIFAFYWVVNRSINNRKQHTLSATKVPVVTSKFQFFEADSIPAPGNGKRMSLAFWIYIHDMNKFSGSYRNVLYRGDMAEPIASHSPTVLLDSKDNRMHILFGTEKGDPYNDKKDQIFGETGTPDSSEENRIRNISYLLATRGITIDYIPIQRWVHVAVVVNEEVNGGVIQAYLDGELVKIVRSENEEKQIGSLMSMTNDTEELKSALSIQNMNLDKRGNVYIGGSMDAPLPGFAGLVSRVTFFNYDLNARDIYKVYMEGPVDGLASKVGVAYGVRTPIYRVG